MTLTWHEHDTNVTNVSTESRPPSHAPDGEGRVVGQLKLSLQYRREALLVMVHHARALPTVGGQEPSTYVKVYLRPDPAKATKRKTKVVRRSCHPSFMEMVSHAHVRRSNVKYDISLTFWACQRQLLWSANVFCAVVSNVDAAANLLQIYERCTQYISLCPGFVSDGRLAPLALTKRRY